MYDRSFLMIRISKSPASSKSKKSHRGVVRQVGKVKRSATSGAYDAIKVRHKVARLMKRKLAENELPSSRVSSATGITRLKRRKQADNELSASLVLSETGTSRLEARIPTHVYEVVEHAARLRGLTMTAFVTSTMAEAALRTIEDTTIMRLSRADQIAFAKALIDPPAPSDRMLAARQRHAELFGK
jgi:uncharacterized protein (DUF1778 family)